MSKQKIRGICDSLSRVSYDTINAQVKLSSYAVRGPIVTRSMELAKICRNEKLKPQELKTLPFDEIISCNIGNPHSLEQSPLTFIREVLCLTMNPELSSRCIFPEDVVKRAKKYLSGIPSVGAYSESQGIYAVRQEVADFLTERDGFPGDAENIFLTNGASDGVRLFLQTILRDPTQDGGQYKDGIMTPIPQYPLYSALITLMNGHFIPYHLDEDNDWGCNAETLEQSLSAAKQEGVTVRGLVIINPGNPTGQIMPKTVMIEIVQWCRRHGICLMADEVYQENIWTDHTGFVSFRQVAYEINAFEGVDAEGHEINNPITPNTTFSPTTKTQKITSTDSDASEVLPPLQLISFHSISKGFLGECGLRGGYFELLGIPVEVKRELYKLASISLCSNTVGQIATGLMVRPPQPNEESHQLYIEEKQDILSSLTRRAGIMRDALNNLEGVSCTNIAGALYAFPTIDLPQTVIDAATAKSVEPDALYCMELLESTGIVVVPGSGFGQVKGSYHFRTTILPPEDKLDTVVNKLTAFHKDFLLRYDYQAHIDQRNNNTTNNSDNSNKK